MTHAKRFFYLGAGVLFGMAITLVGSILSAAPAAPGTGGPIVIDGRPYVYAGQPRAWSSITYNKRALVITTQPDRVFNGGFDSMIQVR